MGEVNDVVSIDADTTFGPTDPLTAEESLAVIERQRAEVSRRLGVNPALFFWPCGVAYLLGFGSIFLTYGTYPLLPVANWVAAVITAVFFAAAMVVSVVCGARAGRGIHGSSRMVGAMYGWSWTLGFLGLLGVNIGLTRLGLSEDAVSLLWSGSSLTGAGSVFAGVPGNFAVLSVAGGGGRA